MFFSSDSRYPCAGTVHSHRSVTSHPCTAAESLKTITIARVAPFRSLPRLSSAITARATVAARSANSTCSVSGHRAAPSRRKVITVRPLTMRQSGDGSTRSARAIASPTDRKLKTSKSSGFTGANIALARTGSPGYNWAPGPNVPLNPRLTLSKRSEVLAQRLEEGVRQLTDLARSLSDEQWQMRVPHDNRKIGVVVHHVGTMYPIEITLAQQIGRGESVEGVTWAKVHEMNADHARSFDRVTKQEALDLLQKNSTAAAVAVRAFSDQQLDTAAALSLNSDGPRTCQFMLEDLAVGHGWHHLLKMRGALGKGETR